MVYNCPTTSCCSNMDEVEVVEKRGVLAQPCSLSPGDGSSSSPSGGEPLASHHIPLEHVAKPGDKAQQEPLFCSKKTKSLVCVIQSQDREDMAMGCTRRVRRWSVRICTPTPAIQRRSPRCWSTRSQVSAGGPGLRGGPGEQAATRAKRCTYATREGLL